MFVCVPGEDRRLLSFEYVYFLLTYLSLNLGRIQSSTSTFEDQQLIKEAHEGTCKKMATKVRKYARKNIREPLY